MKKRFFFVIFLFSFSITLFSQTINSFSTVSRPFSREEIGLHINWLFPGECLFYWCGVFDNSPLSYPLYLDSIEIAIAFERFDQGNANDTLIVDVFKADTTKNYQERYYSYKVDLGKLGFPEKFSSDPYSQYNDTKPTFKKIKFADYKKIIKLNSGLFAVGIRMMKTSMKSPWQNYLLPNSGLHIGKIEFESDNPYKKYSRRYVLYEDGNSSTSKTGKLELAFPSTNWSIYMRAWTSNTLSDQSMLVSSTETPTYKCETITGIPEEKIYDDREFALSQNFPNPFNPSTFIRYEIKQQSRVKIEILNLLGKNIKTLLDTKQDIGSYTIPFDASGLNTGMYFYKISTFNGNKLLFTETKKMLFIK